MRVSQTRRCTRCGHWQLIEVKYPKYFADCTPLVEIARCLRCTACRARKGQIEQEGSVFRYDGTIIRIAAGGRYLNQARR